VNEQEIKTKALEIAAMILGRPMAGQFSNDGEFILRQYLPLADTIEQHLQGKLPSSKTAET
jgi:hypothetical protein